MARGQSQAQACKVLGVSVMTFHRWRKQEAARSGHPVSALVGLVEVDSNNTNATEPERSRMDELRLENERLRRIVTDLLLEKMKIEEKLALESGGTLPRRGRIQG